MVCGAMHFSHPWDLASCHSSNERQGDAGVMRPRPHRPAASAAGRAHARASPFKDGPKPLITRSSAAEREATRHTQLGIGICAYEHQCYVMKLLARTAGGRDRASVKGLVRKGGWKGCAPSSFVLITAKLICHIPPQDLSLRIGMNSHAEAQLGYSSVRQLAQLQIKGSLCVVAGCRKDTHS